MEKLRIHAQQVLYYFLSIHIIDWHILEILFTSFDYIENTDKLCTISMATIIHIAKF